MSNGFLSKLAFWQSSQISGDVGVFITNNALWVCYDETADSTQVVKQIPIIKHDWKQAFEQLKALCGKARVQLVLSFAHYQLLQADKPSVESSEIAQALIWAVKDMVSEPVANIHLDYFESSVTSSAKVSVVVTSRDLLMQLVAACEASGLSIVGISVEELVLRHILPNDSMAHMLVAHAPQEELLLMAVKAGEVLMQRRVRGFNQLNKATFQELQNSIADNLSLEIQRSMDYFESQLRQAPVSSITIVTDGDSPALANLVAANFNQTVHAVNHDGVSGLFAQLALQEIARGEA
ncbi:MULTISPECIES: biogenesis protein MshI [Shewanella]|uniref:Biogenesis protein MshI n=1 Tax=Shewanella metallivivens TaxID=2872342 RepID=A0ABT5TNS5_9GAMM|nr:biogenesis protein MshI [Shewanella metallivivens]MDD8060264.1 biogenesis protein MshI [Shewanella metallivivens]